MKKVILIVGAFVLATAMNAQIQVGANFLIGFPSGDWADGANTGFGGGVEGLYFFNDDLAAGLEINFLSFGLETSGIAGADGSITQLPITVKGEYYFMDDAFRPFVGLGLGYYAGKTKTTVTIPFFGTQTVEANTSGLGLSPRVGAVYQVSDLIGLVLNIQYNLLLTQSVDGTSADSKLNFVGVGIGARVNIPD